MEELSGWFFCNYFVEQCSMRGLHYSAARVALRLPCMSINKNTANKTSGVGQTRRFGRLRWQGIHWAIKKIKKKSEKRIRVAKKTISHSP